MEEKIGECAPWESVRNIFKEMYLYVKKEEFDAL